MDLRDWSIRAYGRKSGKDCVKITHRPLGHERIQGGFHLGMKSAYELMAGMSQPLKRKIINMVNLTTVGMAIALAIKDSRKFGSAEHKAAMEFIVKESDSDSMTENLMRIGNVSAVRQELEKAGLVDKAASDPSALCRAVIAAKAMIK